MLQVGEGEGVEGEDSDAVYEEQDKGVAEIAYETHIVERGEVVVGVLVAQVHGQYIGLEECDESHGTGGKAWRIGKDIDGEAEEERHEHAGDATDVAWHAEYEIYIHEGGGNTKEMDAAEDKRLEERKNDYVCEVTHIQFTVHSAQFS